MIRIDSFWIPIMVVSFSLRSGAVSCPSLPRSSSFSFHKIRRKSWVVGKHGWSCDKGLSLAHSVILDCESDWKQHPSLQLLWAKGRGEGLQVENSWTGVDHLSWLKPIWTEVHHGGEPGMLVHAKLLVDYAKILVFEILSFVLLYFLCIYNFCDARDNIITCNETGEHPHWDHHGAKMLMSTLDSFWSGFLRNVICPFLKCVHPSSAALARKITEVTPQ